MISINRSKELIIRQPRGECQKPRKRAQGTDKRPTPRTNKNFSLSHRPGLSEQLCFIVLYLLVAIFYATPNKYNTGRVDSMSALTYSIALRISTGRPIVWAQLRAHVTNICIIYTYFYWLYAIANSFLHQFIQFFQPQFFQPALKYCPLQGTHGVARFSHNYPAKILNNTSTFNGYSIDSIEFVSDFHR